MRAYISGALMNLEDNRLKRFYEALGETLRDLGVEPYVPHLQIDPQRDPEISPSEVYRRDRDAIAASQLVVAYVGRPSLGVGVEIEIARQLGIPVIALFEREAKVSRMARGSPAIRAEIVFDDPEEALARLRIVVSEILGSGQT